MTKHSANKPSGMWHASIVEQLSQLFLNSWDNSSTIARYHWSRFSPGVLVEPGDRNQVDAARQYSLDIGRSRSGFSLLEVIIATAVLAGSAMVLISLIGTGTRFGVNAEKLSIAVTAAQSVLDEYLIDTSARDDSAEITGVVDGSMQLGYRLSVTDFEGGSESRNAIGPPELIRITVEIFDSQQSLDSGSGRPLCRLTRLIRPIASPSKQTAGVSELSVERGASYE